MREITNSKEYFKSCVKKATSYILFLGFVMIMVCGCSGGKNDLAQEDLVPKDSSKTPQVEVKVKAKDNATAGKAEQNKTESPEVPDPTKVSSVSVDLDEEISFDNPDRMSNLSVDDYGRPNPFLPPAEAIAASRAVASTLPFDLITPPLDDTVDSDASKVIRTKVSGILFDEHNPAAILNMEGMDYLVRTGDVINNYKILAIYKNNVAVQLGNNIYKAGVGELLATDKIKHNVVPNLDSRFGGSSTTAKLGN